MQGLYVMRSTYFDISQGVFHVKSNDPSFIRGDDISDESENEEHGFFTLTDTKKYPSDEKVFLIYE